jgi:indolepyruvate ferredoxin oxidoreductase beta subunit
MAFESATRGSGVGGAASLAAFTAGYEAAVDAARLPSVQPEAVDESLERPLVDSLMQVFEAANSPETRSILRAGIARLVDYQDLDYAHEYLRRLLPVLHIEQRRGEGRQRLLGETARQLALAMSYEDTIRVAESKIHPTRFERIRAEARLDERQILEIAEFLHPRVQEITDSVPSGVGRWLLRTGWARRALERLTRSGKVARTTSITGFLLLYLIASLKPWRRSSLRFAAEQAAIENWLDALTRTAESDYELAIEIAKCRGLVKGYGDTRARGTERFDALISVLPNLMTSPTPAAALANLRGAASADENGEAMRARLRELEIS